MAENSGKSLMQLRDDVCSPAGLTIAGVNVLDRAGLTGILVEAILAAKARTGNGELLRCQPVTMENFSSVKFFNPFLLQTQNAVGRGCEIFAQFGIIVYQARFALPEKG